MWVFGDAAHRMIYQEPNFTSGTSANSMSSSRGKSTPGVRESEPRWPMLVLTGLIAAGAVLLVTPNEMTALNATAKHQRALESNPSDLASREVYPGVLFYRKLDRELAPDARVFFSGVVGPDNSRDIHLYMFARTYLFPREVELSLDRKAIYHDYIYDGVDCASPEELRANGFDVMLKNEKGNVSVIPLTKKGGLKQ
jgi:hypothetical protein